MSRPSFESASGLRPAAAFLMIGAVLALVLGKAWTIAHAEDREQPVRKKVESLPTPDFDVVDRNGQALALSVQRMSLRLSPNSMWQAHTPRRIATRISALLDGSPTAAELLERMIPDARNGVIRVDEEGWTLEYDEASRIQDWIDKNQLSEGVWLRRLPQRALWQIEWRPEWLLSEEVRPRKSNGSDPISPLRWGRCIADGLAVARWPATALDTRKVRWEELEAQRARIWKALMPCCETPAVEVLPPELVGRLISLLDEEGVQHHQMRIDFTHERVHPVREETPGDDAFRILGRWRYLEDLEETGRLASIREPDADEGEQRRLARELLDVKHPRTGLEGLAGRLLTDPSWRFIRPEPARYRYRRDFSVHQPSRRYFFDDRLEDPTPRVYTTIDADLQQHLHRELRQAVADHDPAIAMGVVVEVATGQVLAVDGISPYRVAEFIPTWHLFTPGSTFKVVVMATALEQGVVHPGEEFDTHDGEYRIPNSSRVIHEARGAPKGTITATQALSRSVNAVMVQIGTRVPDDVFHETLRALHYAGPAGSGVGAERAGSIPELPWKRAWSHASVSFGHEVMISLWQHAAALSTVLRGGEFLPLSTIQGVAWDGTYYELPTPEPERVLSAPACEQTRAMMLEGARTGTGMRLTEPERERGVPIVFRSKTGTTEKKPSEPCLHLELERNEHNAALPGGRQDPRFIPFTRMMQRMHREGRPHRRSCYTSSICLVGQVLGEAREIMVLVVIEEPRGEGKFGSDVAGPTALSVLEEALGFTRSGVPVAAITAGKSDYGYEREGSEVDHPWAHGPEQNW